MQYIFDDNILNKLPITYRYMIKERTENIGELYSKVEFSKSVKHRTKFYIVKDSYKPISNYIKLRKDYE